MDSVGEDIRRSVLRQLDGCLSITFRVEKHLSHRHVFVFMRLRDARNHNAVDILKHANLVQSVLRLRQHAERSTEEVTVPEEVLFDAADCKHTTNIAPHTYDLDSEMCPFLNYLIPVVRELRRCGIRVIFDVARDQLGLSATKKWSGTLSVHDSRQRP